MNMWKYIIAIFFLVLFIITIITVPFYVVIGIWNQFKLLDKQVAIGILTAATTIIVSTCTVVLGRYLERKKEIESHFRTKKIEIYDSFLQEFFTLFNPSDSAKVKDASNTEKEQDAMITFLREWQRKMIVWGGQRVLKSYIDWMKRLKNGEPDAKVMWMTEDFFRAIRKDLGHTSNKLKRGDFLHLLLKNADFFIQESKNNPNVTLSEISELEKNMKK